jgi:hypothetical protein
MSKIKRIGIIAEDESDYEASRTIVKRIIKNDKIGFRPRTSNGCGRLKRKAFDYAVDLNSRGCDLLLLFHDLDRNNLAELEKELEEKLAKNPISSYFICIPIEEIEAWFLSDPECIKNTLNLKRIPKIKAQPETILSPKEYLCSLVSSYSDREKIYLNTKHNALLSENISIDLMKEKCKSFKKLYDFIMTQKF